LRTISLFTKGATQNNEGDANSQNKSQNQQTSHPEHARKLLEETRPINIRNLQNQHTRKPRIRIRAQLQMKNRHRFMHKMQ
jgi:hypothetical protein